MPRFVFDSILELTNAIGTIYSMDPTPKSIKIQLVDYYDDTGSDRVRLKWVVTASGKDD